jgi:hypothetical protein
VNEIDEIAPVDEPRQCGRCGEQYHGFEGGSVVVERPNPDGVPAFGAKLCERCYLRLYDIVGEAVWDG